MATITRHIDARPERVFEVLSDGWLYSNWVVGTSHITAVEPAWPQRGAAIYHASGFWPFVTRDRSVVEEVDPPRRIAITAHGKPLGSVSISVELEAEGDGTRVTMCETPVRGIGKWLHNPLLEAMLARRNAECLHRLAAISEQHAHPSWATEPT